MRIALCLLLVAIALQGCARADPLLRFESTRLSMGVQARVVVYAPDAAHAESAVAAAFARLDELEQVMSDYRIDSELVRLCAASGTGPVPVSGDLFRVLNRALAISAATGGAFDPTLGPLTALWRDARQSRRLPDPPLIEAACSRTGRRLVTLDPEKQSVSLAAAGMRLDLGGIGKGYAAHEAVKLLQSRGMARCLVALAGDIALGDPPAPARQPRQPRAGATSVLSPPSGWRVAIAGTSETILLSNTCISTSGDTEQFVEIDAVRYSHILDPRTGLGLTKRVQATVIHPDGSTADALATALCVVGIDGAPALLEQLPGAVALVREPPGPGAREHRTAGFPAAGRP